MSISKYQWTLLVHIVVMQAVIIGIAVYSFTFFVVPWMQAFAVERSTLMIAVSGASIGTAVISPFCGYLMDRFSTKRLLLLGAASFALCLWVISKVSDATWLILLYVLVLPLGMVLSGSLMASSLVARNFTEYRGMAFGVSALGVSVGGFGMPVLVTQLLSLYEWQTVFVYLACIVGVFVVIPSLIFIRDPGQSAEIRAATIKKEAGPRLMLSPSVLKLGLAFFAPVLIFVAVLHNVGALAADYSITQQHAAWVVSIASVVMAVSKLASGILCDRLSHAVIYLAMLAGQCVGLILLSLFSQFTFVLIGVSLIAVGAGGNLPVVTSYAALRWDQDRIGRVMGIVFAMAGLSGIGPVMAGVIRDASGSYTYAFLVLLLVLLPAAWSFLSLSKNIDAIRVDGR